MQLTGRADRMPKHCGHSGCKNSPDPRFYGRCKVCFEPTMVCDAHEWLEGVERCPTCTTNTTYPKWVEFNGESTEHKGLLRCREVAPNLYVGGYAGILGREDWAAVVNYHGYDSDDKEGMPKEYTSAEFRLLRFQDGDPIPELYLTETLAIWDRHQGRPVLLHCAQGVSRSASAAYVVLRLRMGLSHDVALQRVKVYPNYPMEVTLDSAIAYVEHALGGADNG